MVTVCAMIMRSPLPGAEGPALIDINPHLAPGSLALVGENGLGKPA